MDKKIIEKLGRSTNEYHKVGEGFGLDAVTLARFISYMMIRWPNGLEINYALEWAERFHLKAEYNCSDEMGKEVLKAIDSD